MKFSRKIQKIGQAVSIKYNNRVYEMKAAGEDVTVLSLGEAFFDVPLQDFSKLPFPDLYHYSHSRGLDNLRTKLSRFYKDKFGVSSDPKTELIVTAGSKAAIYMALATLVNEKEEVLVLEPAWVSYTEQIKMLGAKPVCVPYDVPIEKLQKYISRKTRVIILNNPNNPSGKLYSRTELESLLVLARKKNLTILSDEAYSDFVTEDERFISMGAIDLEKEHTVVCNSMSKNYGMSGWRVGYIISNSEFCDQFLKLNQHIITCAPTPLLYYLAEHFDWVLSVTHAQIQEVLQQRKWAVDELKRIGIPCLEGNSTFYIFASIAGSQLNSTEFCDQLLEKDKICAVPGVGYGMSCDKFIRLSVGTESRERLGAAFHKIKRLIVSTMKLQEEHELGKQITNSSHWGRPVQS